MAGILGTKTVQVRKDRVCFGCGRKFPIGTKMTVSAVVDGSRLWSCYLCKTCDEITNEMEWDDEYGFMDLRDEAIEREAREG